LITAKVISKTNNGASRNIDTKRKFFSIPILYRRINGIDVTKNIMVHPVVHFMLLKPEVIRIVEG
jgi:hypothetical protein